MADHYGAQLRLTRFRPSGRGADSWEALHPTDQQQRELYHWLMDHPDVLTGDSFFHLSALGEALSGLNLCGAGRVVPDRSGGRRLRLSVRAARRVRRFRARRRRLPEGVAGERPVHRTARRSRRAHARAAATSMRARAAVWRKFFTGIPLDGPDPECVLGHGEEAMDSVARAAVSKDHSRTTVVLGRKPVSRSATAEG